MRELRYLLCTIARAPVCLVGLTAALLRFRPLHRVYLAADTWLCVAGRISDDGKLK